MKTHLRVIGLTGIVLVVSTAAVDPLRTQSATVTLGVTGRTNAYASVASSGSFVGVVWSARTKEGVTDLVWHALSLGTVGERREIIRPGGGCAGEQCERQSRLGVRRRHGSGRRRRRVAGSP